MTRRPAFNRHSDSRTIFGNVSNRFIYFVSNMIFHRTNYEDIRRYYTNTIIKLPNLSGDRLWQIVNINPDEVKMVDVDDMEIYIDLNDEYEVEYPLPGRAVYQMANGRAGILFRRPAKQYYRGLHKDNTSLASYSSSGEFSSITWHLTTLQEFVDKPSYQDVNTIDWDSGDSWALSKHFVLTRGGYVMALQSKVAVVESFTDKKIAMVSKLFKPEIEQLFKGWSIE